jgi:hypothetical protein
MFAFQLCMYLFALHFAFLARQPDFWGGLGTYRPVWASGGRMELVPDTQRRGQRSMCTAPL